MTSTYRSKWLYGLKTQSLLVGGVLGFVVCCLLVFYTLPSQDRWVKKELTNAAERSLRQLSASIVTPLLSHQYAELYESLDAQLSEHRNWLRIKVSDAEGKQLYPLGSWTLGLKEDDIIISHDINFLEKNLGRIVLVANFSAELREGYRLQFTLASVLFVALMLVFGVVYYLINKTVITPLRGLMTSFQQLADGDYHSPLPRVFNNEVANVVAGFAEMRSNIERHQAKLEILRQEAELANRAKSDFLSSMSHELRTPLNAILGLAQLFEYDDAASDVYKSHGKNIYNAGEYLLSLINDVLDLTLIESRNISLNIERFSAADVVGECVDLVTSTASGQGISIYFTRPVPDDILVAGDYTRLKQAIINLLSNAVKYNCAAGIVTVSYLRRESSVRICIDDTGKGLAQEQLDKLFTPFDRLGAELGATQGTGIGLVITKQLLELMGGVMGAESVLGRGSTFWIEMPLATDEHVPMRALLPPEKMAATTASEDVNTALRILVAEDNTVNQDVIRQQLALLGYSATFANDGLAAWQCLQTEEYDVLLTDIQMPKMNGYELTKRIREAELVSGVHLPIVAITANVMERDVADCLASGADDFIPKPVEINALKEILARVDANLGLGNSPAEKYADTHDLRDELEPEPEALAIDISQLVSMIGDDVSMHCMIFKSFTDSSPENIQAILDALSARDPENVYMQAHKFKSSARSMGAYSLADTCAALEAQTHFATAADSESVKHELSQEAWLMLDSLAEQMNNEYAAAKQFIDDYMQQHQ
ncbi:multi-sensor hybrid histidine kinase [gamma proteobacterium BDW918]|nr:multi-sensor hybrid histidine kinase [gamma proteobacterium BDW918]